MGITVSGGRQVADALRAASAQVRANVAAAVDDEAAQIRQDEQAAVPVDTGALQAGIETRRTGDLSAEVGVYDPALAYAIWVEWGRKRAAASPFANPAAEQSRQRWPLRAAEAVKDGARG